MIRKKIIRIFLISFLLAGCFLVCSHHARAETIVLAPLGSDSFDELSLGDTEVRTFSFASAQIASGSMINSVELNVVARSTSESSLIQLKLEKVSDPSVISSGVAQNLTESASHSWTMTVDPFTQSSWTIGEVNNWDINFGVVCNGAGTVSISQISLVVDFTPPLVASMQNPLKGATNVPLNITPTIIFSRSIDPATIKEIKLKKYETSDVIASKVLPDLTGKIVTITPNQPLEPSTRYYLTITTNGVKDLEGNVVPPWLKNTDHQELCHDFTTTNGAIPLGVTSISSTRSLAQADNEWNHGWQWIFNITIPVEETHISMKFDDWNAGDDVLLSAGNARIYCPQSPEHATAETAILIDAVDSYTQLMILAGDIEPTLSGRQIQVIVEVKIPTGSAIGSYSTNYSILTN